jgi:signal peptidase I
MKLGNLLAIFSIFLFILLYLLGFRIIVVLTDSMSPTIPPFSACFVAPSWLIRPQNNSIVLFKFYKFLVLHRVVKIDEKYVITKGDNRSFIDGETPIEDVVGVVLFPIPSYPIVFALIFATFCTAVAYYILRSRLK